MGLDLANGFQFKNIGLHLDEGIGQESAQLGASSQHDGASICDKYRGYDDVPAKSVITRPRHPTRHFKRCEVQYSRI